MFQSYTYKEYFGKKYGKYSFEYDLTDSDFGTVSGVGVEVGGNGWVEIDVGVAVIHEYSKRNLNVGKNLVLAFVWYSKLYPDWGSIQQMIERNKKYNPLFQQYEEDLQKYLLLL